MRGWVTAALVSCGSGIRRSRSTYDALAVRWAAVVGSLVDAPRSPARLRAFLSAFIVASAFWA
ncbi:hypothetical protein ASC77_16100 [Nocardioides sp. Root1257]|uniref:hypothetical protein n=1 Tax=unclassified Nocardioides TaxID=2615069 RepID=UPI0007023CEA|nr:MULTISPECIES: hypothetical protein [unclassified Nocardioides]KQW47929.1 hypothetical protein ASC77_16100 [Nocardioides sp. Root1257]KRC45181.1 hypothetical protein ASE24_17050 [Nocardioides sp. Root224]